MSFSTLSIQFNGIMPCKNGHHHHHQWTTANCVYRVTPKVFKLWNSTTTSSFLMWCWAYCPWMSVDILGTNCDQCQSMVQCRFMSTKTVRLIRTESLGRKAQDGHHDFHTAPELSLSVYIICVFVSTRPHESSKIASALPFPAVEKPARPEPRVFCQLIKTNDSTCD